MLYNSSCTPKITSFPKKREKAFGAGKSRNSVHRKDAYPNAILQIYKEDNHMLRNAAAINAKKAALNLLLGSAADLAAILAANLATANGNGALKAKGRNVILRENMNIFPRKRKNFTGVYPH